MRGIILKQMGMVDEQYRGKNMPTFKIIDLDD
jgi:hypothetical protein